MEDGPGAWGHRRHPTNAIIDDMLADEVLAHVAAESLKEAKAVNPNLDEPSFIMGLFRGWRMGVEQVELMERLMRQSVHDDKVNRLEKIGGDPY